MQKKMKNIQEAVKKVNESLLQKKAGGFADSIGAGIASPTLMNLHPVTGIQRLLAAAGDDPAKEELKGYDKNPIPSLLVGPYRDLRRRREMLARAGKDAGYHVAAEELANPGLGLAAVLGGAAFGSNLSRADNPKDPAYGPRHNARAIKQRQILELALGGAGVAALAAELAAPIVAAITPTRTAEEQLKHDKGSSWKSWLIPGIASYNRYKRLGRIIAEDAEREAPQKKVASAVSKIAADVAGTAKQQYTGFVPTYTGAVARKGAFVRTNPNEASYFEKLPKPTVAEPERSEYSPQAGDAVMARHGSTPANTDIPINQKELAAIREGQTGRIAKSIAEKNPQAYRNLLNYKTWFKGLPGKTEYIQEVQDRLKGHGKLNERTIIKEKITDPAEVKARHDAEQWQQNRERKIKLDPQTVKDIGLFGPTIAGTRIGRQNVVNG